MRARLVLRLLQWAHEEEQVSFPMPSLDQSSEGCTGGRDSFDHRPYDIKQLSLAPRTPRGRECARLVLGGEMAEERLLLQFRPIRDEPAVVTTADVGQPPMLRTDVTGRDTLPTFCMQVHEMCEVGSGWKRP